MAKQGAVWQLRGNVDFFCESLRREGLDVATSSSAIVPIVIGGETKAFNIIAAACKRMQAKHPKIRMNITSGNAQDVTEKLDQRLLDFGLLVEPVDKSKYEFVELPAKDTWGLLVRKDHPLAKKGFVTVRDLENVPLLASRQTMMMREFSGLLGRDLHSLNVIATYNLIYNASVFVEQGLGAALCLEGLLNTGGKSKLTFVPFTPLRTSGLVVVWKKSPVFSKPAAAFLVLEAATARAGIVAPYFRRLRRRLRRRQFIRSVSVSNPKPGLIVQLHNSADNRRNLIQIDASKTDLQATPFNNCSRMFHSHAQIIQETQRIKISGGGIVRILLKMFTNGLEFRETFIDVVRIVNRPCAIVLHKPRPYPIPVSCRNGYPGRNPYCKRSKASQEPSTESVICGYSSFHGVNGCGSISAEN